VALARRNGELSLVHDATSEISKDVVRHVFYETLSNI